MKFTFILLAFAFSMNALAEAIATEDVTAPVRTASAEKPAALVKVKNGKPTCLIPIADDLPKSTKLPLCAENDQTKAATQLASADHPIQNAFLSYGVAAVSGCLWGAFSSVDGAFIGAVIPKVGVTTGAISLSLAQAPALALMVSLDPTGHALTFAGGYVACTGGTDYLIYKYKYKYQ